MPDQVYVTHVESAYRQRHRRILGVLQGYVVYSTGADHTRSCRETSFARWIQRTNAFLWSPFQEPAGGVAEGVASGGLSVIGRAGFIGAADQHATQQE